jgi:omega-amidase
MKVILSLAQLNIKPGKRDENIHHAYELIAEAKYRNSSAILLPELWSSGYDLTDGEYHAHENKGLLKKLIATAHETSMVIAGSLLEIDGKGNLYNVLHVIIPSVQEKVIKYKKIHLFGQMGEKKWLHAGNKIQTASLEWGKTGLAICYDLRFPELFRRYTEMGSTMIFIPAEWPSKRTEHWQILLRARAIENQMFVIAANSVGAGGGEIFAGCSAVISPFGETIIEGSSTREELLTTEIDLSQVGEVRNMLPIIHDRRPDIYG